MLRYIFMVLVIVSVIFSAGCAKSYKATPMSFKMPSAYGNVKSVGGAQIAARAFADSDKAKEAFGFDIRGAGLLPVQVIFDNSGSHSLEIDGQQTFLEDENGNLWQILSRKNAHDRATKYSQTKQIVKEGAYNGFLGATAGAIVGAAVGVVTGENVASAAGQGAAVGAAAGATLGGVKGYSSDEAARIITSDLREKSMQSRAIEPQSLAHGFLFFPGEASLAKKLRLKLLEKDTGKSHIINFDI